MENLGLNLGFLLVQIFNFILVILVVGLPLGLALLAHRWMTEVTQRLERLERRLQSLDEHLEEVLDYLAEQEEG